MEKISKFILYNILGWRVENGFPETPKKYIIIPIAILARMSQGKMVHFIGKGSLFKWPFGYFFKALGGTPVDRDKSTNMVEGVINIFNSKEEFRLGLSPEGTRKKVDKWKTGFYYIAKGANVPIVMATLDFENKKIKISEPYYVTEDIQKDFKVFDNFYKDVKGKNPELS